MYGLMDCTPLLDCSCQIHENFKSDPASRRGMTCFFTQACDLLMTRGACKRSNCLEAQDQSPPAQHMR